MHILPAAFFDDTVKMKGEGSGLAFPETVASKDTGQATGTLLSTGALPDHVDQYPFADPLYINWYLSHDDGASWFGPFASGNETFVTLGNPLGDPTANPPVPGCQTPFRTVLYLATKDSEATTESQCVTNTWANFSGRNVCAWNDTLRTYSVPLYYYLSQGPPDNVPALLQGHDGDCTAWADFLKQCLLANNVSNVAVSTAGANPWLRIVAKEADPKDPTFACTVNNETRHGSEDFDGNPGINGQGNGGRTPSSKWFAFHRVVKVGSTYYDPSYGVEPFDDTTADKTTYTQGAIALGELRLRCDDGIDRDLLWETQKANGTLWEGPLYFAP